ncbi:phosphocarrier protein [Anaerobranca californiensis DSM 14826]|jgi:phosphocarrier protein|uniref:Phosphocarrier protein HPr n=1 Tax=Anaerobranca californiensis DSM 14826 TaxID=1120989 RepID=A0A1M6NYE1_9FIRM|nr:HPr family phosphocarrier protein [Anaerobranca californiensis]SHK00706.1 phosphocarrier protein [Anaerobranca californiensis DSM 14826]
MLERKITVTNKTGLHARPAALLVQTASKFSSDITLVKEGSEVNAKSIMGIMALGAGPGTELTIKVSGADEEEALNALLELFNSNFGE